MTRIIEFVLFVTVITSTEAVRCNFIYKQADIIDVTATTPFPYNQRNTLVKYDDTKNKVFKCEEPLLDAEFEEVNIRKFVLYSSKPSITSFDTRMEVDSDYVEIENLCETSKKTIQPKELNNVYDKLVKIAVVQTFTIELCGKVKANCSKDPVPPNKKVICKQNYLTIKLMAYDDLNKKYEENFYYPSACTCATYMRRSDII